METNILRENIAEKVKAALKQQGKKKVWLYSRMEMTPQTLDSRLKSNAWSVAELVKLQDLLGIK